MDEKSGKENEPERLNPAASRQFFQSGAEADFFVFVVCTDRGQHKRMLLTTARRELGCGHGMNSALQWFAPPDPDAGAGTATGHDSYVFWCPRCTRAPHIKKERWWQTIDELGRLGIRELDISLLPF